MYLHFVGQLYYNIAMEQKYQTLAFIVIVLLASWLTQIIIFTGMVPARFTIIYMFIPAVIAVIFFFLFEKNPIRRQLNLFISRLSLRSIGFAIIYPVIWFLGVTVVAITAGLGQLNTDFLPELTSTPYLLGYLMAVIAGLPIFLGEEYGWRGYLLPKLTDQHGKIKAVLLVGLVWGLWHIPSYYIAYSSMNIGDPIILTLIGVSVGVVASFPYAYAFYLTKGNIIPAVIIHSVYDITAVKIFFGTPSVAGLMEGSAGLLLIKWPIALLLIVMTGLAFAPLFIRGFNRS